MSTNISTPTTTTATATANKTEIKKEHNEPTPETETEKEITIPRIKVLSDAFIKTYPSSRTCFVLGSTGESGKRLARDLINSGAFSLIKLIARRPVPEEFVPEPPVGVKIVRFFISYHIISYHISHVFVYNISLLGTSNHSRFQYNR